MDHRPPLVLACLLFAGCVGSPAPEAVPTSVPEPPSLRLMVTNDELIPIPDVIAYIDDRPEPAFGDEFGSVWFPNVTDGRHEVRLWAPDHYRRAENVTFNASQEEAIPLVLSRRPPDYVSLGRDFKDGVCFLAMRSGQGLGETQCVARPRFPSPPPTFVDLRLSYARDAAVTQRFHNATIWFAWGQAPIEQMPVLEARILPNGTFPGGQKILTFSGPGPFVIDIQATDLDPSLLKGDHRIRLAPMPSQTGETRILFDLAFHADIWIGTQFVAPPNPPWTG